MVLQTGAFQARFHHRGSPIRQKGQLKAVFLKYLDHSSDVGPWLQLQIRRHQSHPLLRIEIHAALFSRVTQGVSGYVPEIRVLAHGVARPGVLKLSRAPLVLNSTTTRKDFLRQTED